MREVRIAPWTISVLFAVNMAAACSARAPQSADPVPADPGDPGSTAASGGDNGSGGAPPRASCSLASPAQVVSDANGVTPSLAWNGTVVGVTWASVDGSEIFAAVVSPTGARIGQVSLGKGPSSQDPTIYSDPAGFLVVWSSGGSIMGQRLDAKAKLSGLPIQISISGSLTPHPKGAAFGSSLLLAFEGPTSGMIGLFSGNSLGNTIELSGTPAFPAPVSNGTSAGVFWTGVNKTINFGVVSTPLALASTVSVTGKAKSKATAMHGSDSYVTWEDDSLGNGSEQVYVAKVTGDGSFSAPVAVPTELASANSPAIAVAGDTIAVVYYQFRDGPPSIFLSLFNSDLTRLSGDFTVSPTTESDRSPSIVWTGKDLVVAYAEDQGLVKIVRVDCK